MRSNLFGARNLTSGGPSSKWTWGGGGFHARSSNVSLCRHSSPTRRTNIMQHQTSLFLVVGPKTEGPFGAAVVRNGVIISCAHNMVLERRPVLNVDCVLKDVESIESVLAGKIHAAMRRWMPSNKPARFKHMKNQIASSSSWVKASTFGPVYAIQILRRWGHMIFPIVNFILLAACLRGTLMHCLHVEMYWM